MVNHSKQQKNALNPNWPASLAAAVSSYFWFLILILMWKTRSFYCVISLTVARLMGLFVFSAKNTSDLLCVNASNYWPKLFSNVIASSRFCSYYSMVVLCKMANTKNKFDKNRTAHFSPASLFHRQSVSQ